MSSPRFPRTIRCVIIDQSLNVNSKDFEEQSERIAALNNKICLREFPFLNFVISARTGYIYPGIIPENELWRNTNQIEFSISFKSETFSKATQVVDAYLESEGIDPCQKTKGDHYTIRGFVMVNKILRELEYVACLVLISDLLTHDKPFPAWKIFTHYNERYSPFSCFKLNVLIKADVISRYPMIDLDVNDVFVNLKTISESIPDDRYPQNLRAIAYFIKGLRQQDELSRLIWFVATIEAALVKNSENSSMNLVIERAKAVLTDKAAFIAHDLKKIYKIRHAFIHGNTDILQHLGGSELFPISKPKSGDLQWSFHEADLAQRIALRMVQLFLSSGRSSIDFRTVLK